MSFSTMVFQYVLHGLELLQRSRFQDGQFCSNNLLFFYFHNCIVPPSHWDFSHEKFRLLSLWCFCVSMIRWTLTWTTGSLTCAHMLMRLIHRGVWTHVRVSAPEALQLFAHEGMFRNMLQCFWLAGLDFPMMLTSCHWAHTLQHAIFFVPCCFDHSCRVWM